jgi:hypothetical protein
MPLYTSASANNTEVVDTPGDKPMKLFIRSAVLTLCIAGVAAGAIVPTNARMSNHQLATGLHPTPSAHPVPGCNGCGIFK